MVRWSVALVVSVLASGCLAAEERDAGEGEGTPSPTATSTTSTSRSTTYTPSSLPPPDEWDAGAWVDAACPPMQPIMAPYFFADLAVRNGSRIVVLRNGPDHRYLVHAEGAEGTRFVAAAPGAVFAARDVDLPTGRVVQYDVELNEVRSVQVGEVGSLHREGDTLYVGGLGRLTALSLDLAVKDVLEFDEPRFSAKRIDYITIHRRSNQDVVAYLVDDIVQPFRLYRVDATDPGAMRELGNHTVHSSTSPGPQWIDFAAKQWYVGTTFYGGGPDGVGHGESATAIGLDGAAAEEAVAFHSRWTRDSGATTETGYDVAASSAFLPAWTVLDGNGSRTFAQVAFKDGVPSKACDLALGPVEGQAFLAFDYGWPVVAAGNDLWYIDHSRGPVVGRSQSVAFGITGLAVMS